MFIIWLLRTTLEEQPLSKKGQIIFLGFVFISEASDPQNLLKIAPLLTVIQTP